MLLLLVNTIAAPLSWGGIAGVPDLVVRRPRHPHPPSQPLLPSPRTRELDPGPLGGGKEQTFERALDWAGVGGREVLGPPQVASAARSLGRLGPRNGGAGPSLVSASGFSSFIFWGGVSFAFRGDQAWRPPHHALGHPTSFPSPSPRANFEDRAFQVGEGGSQKGSWRSLDRRVGAGVNSPWARAARTPLLGPS